MDNEEHDPRKPQSDTHELRGALPIEYHGGRTETSPALRCAWVALVMVGRSYVPGALAMAQSLRDARTRHPIVCMVTDDVPKDAVAQLSLLFDSVVAVPYIAHRTNPPKSSRQTELYKGWIDKSFTKWNCLALTEYDRVGFVDADIIAMTNIDDLFELPPPAATYANAYAQPWTQERGIQNPYSSLLDCPKDEKVCDLAHGRQIPAAMIRAAAKEGFVGGASLMILKPSKADFEGIKAFIARDPVFGVGLTTKSGPDEVSIALYYAEKPADWTNIHQKYQAIPWKKNWVSHDIRGFHFIGRKPWDQEREEWPDIADWWKVADRVLHRNPGLREVFFPTVTHVTGLDADMAQYRLTMDIRAMLTAAARNAAPVARKFNVVAARAEVDNIVERWLMALVNSAGPGPDAHWATVYRVVSPEEPFNNKLAGELVEKKIALNATAAGVMVRDILAIITRRLSKLPRPSGDQPVLNADSLSYGSHFRTNMTPRIRRLIELGNVEKAAAVVLRYAVVVSAGQQWGLPQAHVDYLYDNFGVRGEAFASPLNARLLGKKQAVFCSVFPDTDSPYGSIGSFFKLSPEAIAQVGNWVVNPPFVEALLEKAATIVVDALDRAAAARRDQTFFFIIPAWKDMPAYRILHDCRYMVAERRLVYGEYSYEDPSGARIDTRASSIYFALSTGPADLIGKLESALLVRMR